MMHLAAIMQLRFIILNLNDIELRSTAASLLWTLWAASAVSGAISVLYFRDCWGPVGILLLYTLVSFGCFYASYAILDVRLDHVRPVAVHSARILGKEITSSGRSSHGILKLDVLPGGPVPAEYAGSWNLYEAVKVGGSICFYEHAGALGTGWHKIAACPQGPT